MRRFEDNREQAFNKDACVVLKTIETIETIFLIVMVKQI